MIPDFTRLIELALEEDFGTQGDVTSLATIPHDQHIHARIMAKAGGVVAGIAVISQVYQLIDPSIGVKLLLNDGERVSAGTVLAEISGSAQKILSGERTIINFLQHLSGIATLTRCFVDAVAHTKAIILDTRKTTPAWRKLEKYAVQMGGAHNHRTGLYDMVLIKDNHIDGAGSIEAAVGRVRDEFGAQYPIEVEVKNLDELETALSLNVDRIMLDNMDLAAMRQAVERTAGKIPLEASGNVSLERIRAIAETGVDFISIGALTHSVPVFDFSLRLR